MKKIILLLALVFGGKTFAQIQRVEPPNWWIGFEDKSLQLLVHGDDIGEYEAQIDYEGVSLQNVHQADSPNYLFLDLLKSVSLETTKTTQTSPLLSEISSPTL